jgi:hypothetical protein
MPATTTSRVARQLSELGLIRHGKAAQVPDDSPLNLGGLFRTGKGVLRYSGALAGRSLAVYQHQYMVFAGTTTFPVIHTIYLVEVSPHWPSITIKRRSVLSHIGRLLGRAGGLQLDDPRFNRAFNVTAADNDFAIALLTPDVQRHLLTKRALMWRIDLCRLALIYNGKLKDKRIAASLQRIRGFLERIPDELEAWGF